jgi:hypothetical protein
MQLMKIPRYDKPQAKAVTGTLWFRAVEFPSRVEAKVVESGGLQGPEKHTLLGKPRPWSEVQADYMLSLEEVAGIESRLQTGEWVYAGEIARGT